MQALFLKALCLWHRLIYVWYLQVLQWQTTEQSWVTVTGETKQGGVGEISALRQKIIVKLSHLYDPKVIQHEAEHTMCRLWGRIPNEAAFALGCQNPAPHSPCLLFCGHWRIHPLLQMTFEIQVKIPIADKPHSHSLVQEKWASLRRRHSGGSSKAFPCCKFSLSFPWVPQPDKAPDVPQNPCQHSKKQY